jgi:uncharacterized protein YjdB
MSRKAGIAYPTAVAVLALVLMSCDAGSFGDPPGPGPAAVAVVEVEPASASLGLSDTLRLTAIVRDLNGNVLEGHPVTWASSSSSIVSVTGTGLATAHAEGSARVTARSDNVVGSATIVATAPSGPTPGSIAMSPSAGTLYVGDTLTLTATARDDSGSVIPDPEFTWASLDPDIATIDGMGRLVGRSVGTAVITVSALCCAADSGAFMIEMHAPGTVQDLQSASVTHRTVTLRWTEVHDGSGAPASYLLRFQEAPYGHWGTAAPVAEGSCAGVVEGAAIGEPRTCAVEGLAPSTTYGFQIIAFRGPAPGDAVFGNVSDVITATTEAGDTGSTGILTVSPSSHTFTEIGQALQLSVTARGSDGHVIDDPGVTWTSRNSEVATVDSNGRVIARGVGSAMIVATALCCSDGAAYVTMPESPTNPHFTNEPAGFVELTRNDWSTLPGSWRPTAWGTTGGSSPPGWEGPPAESSIVTDETAPIGGSSVLRGWYPEGFPGGYGAGRTGYNFGSNPPTRVFVGMWTKVDPFFVNHMFQLKWHYFYVAPAAANAWAWIDWRHRFEGNVSDPANYETSNLRMRFQGSGWSRDELQEQNVQTSIVEFGRGVWTKLEMFIDIGTPGTPNGVLRLWQDGVLIVELTDLQFPANATGIDRFYHEGTYGGGSQPHPRDQAWYVAQTYISVPGS